MNPSRSWLFFDKMAKMDMIVKLQQTGQMA